MKTVTFVKPYELYFAGDSAQFEAELADKLIAAGIAKEYEGVSEAEKKATTKKF